MKKKFLSALLAAGLVFGLAACGGDTDVPVSDAPGVDLTGDGYASDVDYTVLAGQTIRVAASPVPHAEILKVAQDILAKANVNLEIVEFTDYVQPNLVTENEEVDANYFQHEPYLVDFNAENGTRLVTAASIHYEPLGIYPGKVKSLDELPDGADVAVPNDTTNEARALQLLAAQGLITLKEGAGLTATKNDIAENPKNLNIVEMEAAQLPRTLQDLDMAVINGNYATQAGFNSAADALAAEDAESEAAQTYANIVCVKEGNESSDKTKALVAALKSQAVKDYIAENYGGAVVAIF